MDREEIKLAKSFGTHDGGFHADEVTACALLLHFGLIDRSNIVRSRNLDRLASCEYVCDVGGIYSPVEKRFDHHQSDYEGSLSSAGMILSYLFHMGEFEGKYYKFMKQNLIDGVDAIDTGAFQPPVGLCTYSQVIAGFMPPSYEATEVEMDEGFYRALDFAIAHIERMTARYQELRRSEHYVTEKMKESDVCITFEQSLPWLEAFFDHGGIEHPAQFVIMPARGHWKLRGIPPSLEQRMKVRTPLPKEWAGLLEKDLQEVTGIKGALFCHKERFISIWETKEDAQKALELVLAM